MQFLYSFKLEGEEGCNYIKRLSHTLSTDNSCMKSSIRSSRASLPGRESLPSLEFVYMQTQQVGILYNPLEIRTEIRQKRTPYLFPYIVSIAIRCCRITSSNKNPGSAWWRMESVEKSDAAALHSGFFSGRTEGTAPMRNSSVLSRERQSALHLERN